MCLVELFVLDFQFYLMYGKLVGHFRQISPFQVRYSVLL
jgi:hypothetical protein